jgi:hypothetical protein
VLRRVADQLALPGASDLRGDLTQVVVAEDLFTLCEPELELGETSLYFYLYIFEYRKTHRQLQEVYMLLNSKYRINQHRKV